MNNSPTRTEHLLVSLSYNLRQKALDAHSRALFDVELKWLIPAIP